MEKSESKGSFERWQANAIAQLTYAANLVMTLAVATLGFQSSLLFNDKFQPIFWQNHLFVLSIAAILISALAGLCLTINRLLDFRKTKEVARLRSDGVAASKIEPHRDSYKKHGKQTWRLFYLQVFTFGAGILLMVVDVAWIASDKLF